MKKKILLLLVLVISIAVQAADLTGVKIYVNPGHGGYDGDDRSIWTIPVPELWSNPNGFWESKSNLVKGLALRDLLQAAGATVIMSRTENRSTDDRNLTQIAQEANANNVDHFLSIHSNALTGNGLTNYLLLLYHGDDNAPTVAASLPMVQSSGPIQINNPLTIWSSSNPMLRGDFSFYNDRSGLGVLRPLTVPGFLSEGSFHDYPPETHRLCNNDYCKLEALRFLQHFHNYFKRDLPVNGTIAGWVKSENEIMSVPMFIYVSGSVDRWLPLNGATVELLDAAGTSVLQTYTTDNWYNGIYAFYDVAPGNYKLRFSKTDYTEKTVDISVDASQIAYAKVQLNNYAVFQILSPAPDDDISLTPMFLWMEQSATSNYTLEISTNNQLSSLVYSATVQTTAHTIPEKTLVMGTTYFARVTASDGVTQAVSPVTSFSVKEMDVPTPQIISPVNESEFPGTSLVISWQEQTAKGFRVELATTPSFAPIGLQIKTTGAYNFRAQYDNLKAGVYYIRVAGQKSNGISSYSDVVKVTMGVTGIDKIACQPLDAYVTNGNLIIQSERSELLTVSIFNLTGQLLSVANYSLQTGENIIPLNTSVLNKGIYLIRLQTAERNLTLRVQ